MSEQISSLGNSASPFPTFLDLFAPFQTFPDLKHTQAEPSLKPVIGKQQETD
jgi:hypothetical protein